MPHYKDGLEAKVGDVVKGKGYNVLHEIIGKVVDVRPGDSCNLTVACIVKNSALTIDSSSGVVVAKVDVYMEYGETKAFEKIA